MFTTFQAGNGPPPEKEKRQRSVQHACQHCRHRKVRCNGQSPCSHCEYTQHECIYAKPPLGASGVEQVPGSAPGGSAAKPKASSRKRSISKPVRPGGLSSTAVAAAAATTASHDGEVDARSVLARLFPGSDVKELDKLDKSQLVDRMLSQDSALKQSQEETEAAPGSEGEHERDQINVLEIAPVLDNIIRDELDCDNDHFSPTSDDVNALSLSDGKNSSFVGTSSIAVALKVLSLLNPTDGPITPDAANGPLDLLERRSQSVEPPIWDEMTLVNAYFSDFHPFVPIVDEAKFRIDLLNGSRSDASWLALLNIILALGTIAASDANDSSHVLFYKQARNHITIETLGSGQADAIQALALMGGWYLHYAGRPNMAISLLGAAIRMACAQGLHRDAPARKDSQDQNTNDFSSSANMRRRIWWCLFCLDTWGSIATGRPSMGRLNSAVTTKLPTVHHERGSSTRHPSFDRPDLLPTILRLETEYCKIATRVQDTLAEQPLLELNKATSILEDLKNWHEKLLASLPTNLDRRFKTCRGVMIWRFYNLQILVRRPVFLMSSLRFVNHGATMSKKSQIGATMGTEQQRAVKECRQAANETINSVRSLWQPCQMSAWNAVWLLFQAVVIPIVTLASEQHPLGDHEAAADAANQIEAALELFALMNKWSYMAARTRKVVLKLYQRAKAAGQIYNQQPGPNMLFTTNIEGQDQVAEEDFSNLVSSTEHFDQIMPDLNSMAPLNVVSQSTSWNDNTCPNPSNMSSGVGQFWEQLAWGDSFNSPPLPPQNMKFDMLFAHGNPSGSPSSQSMNTAPQFDHQDPQQHPTSQPYRQPPYQHYHY